MFKLLLGVALFIIATNSERWAWFKKLQIYAVPWITSPCWMLFM